MKAILLAICATLTLSACVSSGPATAWGKEGVTMMDYRTDGGQCAVYAATATPETVENNQAGGISGSNETARLPPPKVGPTDPNTGQPTPPTGEAFPTGGSIYRDGNNADYASRAATQQQMREVALAKARTQALKNCLIERGYTEFNLTPEQKAKLATLPEGSIERREYLFKLGTDPEVLKSQAVARKQGS
ncbi:MAG TPA: hypothetical protein VFV88_09025 [Steroidobacteraceae bacterium]|nr:hypothetical protein [Steroidobacteraceae bacterium]